MFVFQSVYNFVSQYAYNFVSPYAHNFVSQYAYKFVSQSVYMFVSQSVYMFVSQSVYMFVSESAYKCTINRFWPEHIRQRVNSTYTYFVSGLGVTSVAAYATTRATSIMRFMAGRPFVVSSYILSAIIYWRSYARPPCMFWK